VIRVEINMHGNLRRFLPDGISSIQLDLPDGTTVRNVVDQLRAENDIWLASIGNMVVPLSTELNNGAELDLFPVLEGG
jgi:molybdopterin converting factor small subunit